MIGAEWHSRNISALGHPWVLDFRLSLSMTGLRPDRAGRRGSPITDQGNPRGSRLPTFIIGLKQYRIALLYAFLEGQRGRQCLKAISEESRSLGRSHRPILTLISIHRRNQQSRRNWQVSFMRFRAGRFVLLRHDLPANDLVDELERACYPASPGSISIRHGRIGPCHPVCLANLPFAFGAATNGFAIRKTEERRCCFDIENSLSIWGGKSPPGFQAEGLGPWGRAGSTVWLVSGVSGITRKRGILFGEVMQSLWRSSPCSPLGLGLHSNRNAPVGEMNSDSRMIGIGFNAEGVTRCGVLETRTAPKDQPARSSSTFPGRRP